MKICNTCKIEKDESEFSKCRSKKDGLQGKCKGCARKYEKEYGLIPENKKHKKEHNKEYCSIPKNKKRIKKYQKGWGKKYYSIPKNKEHKKEYQREYHKKYRLIPKNKERKKQASKKYKKNNPDKVLKSKAERRSLEVRACTIEFTKEQYFDRMSVFGFRCAYCGGPWEHDDHVIPLSKGGLHILANLRPACAHCNCSKGNKLLSEWKRIKDTK